MDKAALEASLNALDLWLIGFGILVAIGVAGESVAGFLHWRRSNDLQRIQTAENLDLQRIIESERLARIQLEAKISPRTLDDQAQARIVEKLKQFAGSGIDLIVFVQGATPDTLPISFSINQSLLKAKIDSRLWTTISSSAVVTGILVSVRDGADSKTASEADALIAALNAEHIVATKWQPFKTGKLEDVLGVSGVNGPPWAEDKVAPIRMLIGNKP